MNSQEHEIWNEQMARKYNPDKFITRSGKIIRWVESIRLKKTKQALDCQPNDAVLDLGCGPGNLLEQLSGKRVVGVDLSDTLLELARQRVKGHPNTEVIKGNAEALPFSNGIFDRVVCSEVLEHVQNPLGVMSEIHRVSKPGAHVVITVPNETLINLSKRIVLMLGIKKFIAGEYPMTDNMLDEWHLSELSHEWVGTIDPKLFRLQGYVNAPTWIWPYHRIFSFLVQNT